MSAGMDLIGVVAGAAGAGTLELPAVLRRRNADKTLVVAQGPLGAIVDAMICLTEAERNEFTIGFAAGP